MLAVLVVVIVLLAAYFALRKPKQKCTETAQCPLGEKCSGGYCVSCGCAKDEQCVGGQCIKCSCPAGQKCYYGKCVQSKIDYRNIQDNYKPFNYQVNSIKINSGVVVDIVGKYALVQAILRDFYKEQVVLDTANSSMSPIVAALGPATSLGTYQQLKGNLLNAQEALGKMAKPISKLASVIPHVKVSAAERARAIDYIQKTQAAYTGAVQKNAELLSELGG